MQGQRLKYFQSGNLSYNYAIKMKVIEQPIQFTEFIIMSGQTISLCILLRIKQVYCPLQYKTKIKFNIQLKNQLQIIFRGEISPLCHR